MSLLVNLGLNSLWTLPAWAMLLLHIMGKIAVWWFWGTIAFYVLVIIIMTLALMAASKAGGTIVQGSKQNVNPYSSQGYSPMTTETIAVPDSDELPDDI